MKAVSRNRSGGRSGCRGNYSGSSRRLKKTSPQSRRSEPAEILLGAHMSIAGGVHRAIERSRSISCTAMQIFVKNNMQWFARPLTREEINAFLNHAQRTELGSVFAHANYLINLAATNPTFHANSLRALSEELIRADQLEIPFIVLHPGAHLGAGEEAGLEKIIASIDKIFAGLPKIKTRIALETTAGQGSCLGEKFGHLAYIIS
ncbi:MAG TPA: deoxyribonuclease IV, partial [Chthoniobacterales bacterium]